MTNGITPAEQSAWQAGVDAGREMERQNAACGAQNEGCEGQGAEPVKHPSYDPDCCQGHKAESDCKCARYDAAAPVKVPSDEILHLAFLHGVGARPGVGEACIVQFARALLARYGQPATVAQEPEPRPDDYVSFKDWYGKDAPDESEASPFDMARHAWLAGVRFADLFPAAPVAAQLQPSGNAGELPDAVAWMTHHDEPMVFLSASECAHYCDEGEVPIPLVVGLQVEDYAAASVRAALDAQASGDDREDSERLDWLDEQAQTSRTGVSIDYVYDAEDGYVNEKGFRFMRHRFIGPLGKTAREAIDHARRVMENKS